MKQKVLLSALCLGLLSATFACSTQTHTSQSSTASEQTLNAEIFLGDYYNETDNQPIMRLTKNTEGKLVLTHLLSGVEMIGENGYNHVDFSYEEAFAECDNPGCSVVTMITAELSNLQNAERIWTIDASVYRHYLHPETDEDPSGVVVSHMTLKKRN